MELESVGGMGLNEVCANGEGRRARRKAGRGCGEVLGDVCVWGGYGGHSEKRGKSVTRQQDVGGVRGSRVLRLGLGDK